MTTERAEEILNEIRDFHEDVEILINRAGIKKKFVAKNMGLTERQFRFRVQNKNFSPEEIYKFCKLLKL